MRLVAMDHPLRRPEEILAFRTLAKILEGRPRILWSVRPADTVQAALETMAEKRTGFLVVLDQGALAGVVSERDVVGRAVLAKKPLETTKVSDIMVRNVFTATLSSTFADCLRLMHQHNIRYLPIIDEGRPVTVISIRDLLREAVTYHNKIIAELERERLTIFTRTV